MVHSNINVPAAFYTSQEIHLTALDSDNFCLDFLCFSLMLYMNCLGV